MVFSQNPKRPRHRLAPALVRAGVRARHAIAGAGAAATLALLATLAGTLAATAHAGPASPDAAAALVSEKLAITWAVKTPLTLTPADLHADAADVVELAVTRQVDGKPVASQVRGVRLTALLDRAALAGADHNDWKHAVVLASANDGYSVSFSWSELSRVHVRILAPLRPGEAQSVATATITA